MPKPLAKAIASAPIHSSAPYPHARSVAPIRDDAIEWAHSPARLLHERLIATFAPPLPQEPSETLSPREKLIILVGTSAALWLMIGIAVAMVLV